LPRRHHCIKNAAGKQYLPAIGIFSRYARNFVAGVVGAGGKRRAFPVTVYVLAVSACRKDLRHFVPTNAETPKTLP
jgi:hypothetical protein